MVDTQRFRPGNLRREGPLKLLAVGRVVKEKRFDRFISVLGRLRKELNLDVLGQIAGPAQDNDLQKELEAQAVSLGLLPGCLQFLGAVSDMSPVYEQADICMLTSDYEGTPNVLLEAMASGLPIVATSVGGVPEIVRHGQTGFLFARQELDGMVQALARLATTRSLRTDMGRRARQHVEENHALERLPAYLDKLYDRALPARFLSPWAVFKASRLKP